MTTIADEGQQPCSDDGSKTDRPGPDDRHDVAWPDGTGCHTDFVRRWQDVGQHEGRLVADRSGSGYTEVSANGTRTFSACVPSIR